MPFFPHAARLLKEAAQYGPVSLLPQASTVKEATNLLTHSFPFPSLFFFFFNHRAIRTPFENGTSFVVIIAASLRYSVPQSSPKHHFRK